MFDWLNSFVADSPLTYLLVAGLAVADIVGVFPSETVVVTASLLAVDGKLSLIAVGVAAFAGAVAGDNLLYLLGRRVGDRLTAWLFRGERARERLDWARRRMHEHGTAIVIAGRFVPMGRTATMFAAGTLRVPWRRFIVADLIAVALWGAYWVGMPAVAGEAFSGRQWLTVLLAIGIGTVIGTAAEVVRRFLERRRSRRRNGRR